MLRRRRSSYWILSPLQGKDQHLLNVTGNTVLTAGQVLSAIAPNLASTKVPGRRSARQAALLIY